MDNHTPGPWNIFVRPSDTMTMIVAQGCDYSICNITDYAGMPCEANARLIAAAPELLESLKFLLARYVQIANSGDAGFWDPEKEPPVMEARAAIAKAEGCLQTFDCNAGDHADCCPAKQ